MKFSTTEDIGAPIERVFSLATEFDGYERAAMRRGATVLRLDSLSNPGPGMIWRANFLMRGREREVELQIVHFDSPNEVAVSSASPGMEGSGTMKLIALSKSRTRMALEFEIAATTLSARLLLQSMKLAKATLNKRFKLRTSQFAKSIEDRAAG